MHDFSDVPIPTKSFYRMGDVARYVGVDAHVIRYWETEFPQIEPMKGQGRQRMFRRDDVLLLRKIRHLLYVQGYTIEGARKALQEPVEAGSEVLGAAIDELRTVVRRLQKYR